MSLISKSCIIKWNSANKKHYKLKGYKFTKIGDEFEVKIEDVTKACCSLIEYNCDYCKKVFESSYREHYRRKNGKSIIKNDVCDDCIGIKRKETNKILNEKNPNRKDIIKNKTRQTNLNKYGVEYVSQVGKFKEKIKKTNLEKYGVECNLQSQEIKEKIKQTNLKKYGVEHYVKTQKFKKQVKETNLKKYGVENVYASEKIKNKIKQTNLDKYGVEYLFQDREKMSQGMLRKHGVKYPHQSKEIRQKVVEAFYKNGNGPSSKPQDYLCKLLNGKNNYPVGGLSLDIAYPEEMLYIEYNGGGHYIRASLEEVNKKDMKRRYYLIGQGWKSITIISKKDKMLSDDITIQLIDKCKEYLNSEKHWIEVDIDNDMINCSEYNKKNKIVNIRNFLN